MSRRRAVYAAFAISGAAGLVYEVLWSRYLGLYVGNGAYAQVLVLSVYLGGMAVGSIAVASLTQRVRHPLLWYAAAEGVLALFGFAFHALFLFATLIVRPLANAVGASEGLAMPARVEELLAQLEAKAANPDEPAAVPQMGTSPADQLALVAGAHGEESVNTIRGWLRES